jgi:error-prone DNA polymerase
MDRFVHLQVCSSCSYLNAASSPEALVATAAAHGMGALALTDRDNPYGAIARLFRPDRLQSSQRL